MKSLINVTIYTKDAVSKPAPNSTQVDAVCALLCGMQIWSISYLVSLRGPNVDTQYGFAFASSKNITFPQ